MVTAIITAAGSGKRFGTNKMLAKINGYTILEHTVNQFFKVKEIGEILVTYKDIDQKKYQKILKKFGKKVKLVKGGIERINSAYNAAKLAKGDIIIIHDGARPFVPTKLIEEIIKAAKEYNASMCAVKPTATVKYVKNNFIEKSFPRIETWIAQTPQAFKKEIIISAYERALASDDITPTDDSDLVGKTGQKIKMIEGRDFNVKITFPYELAIAKKLYQFIKKELE